MYYNTKTATRYPRLLGYILNHRQDIAFTQPSEGWINHLDQSVNLAVKPSEGFIFRHNTEQREPIRLTPGFNQFNQFSAKPNWFQVLFPYSLAVTLLRKISLDQSFLSQDSFPTRRDKLLILPETSLRE